MIRSCTGLRAALYQQQVIGGFAMSSVRVQLNEQEAAEYAKRGQAATDELAQHVMENPRFFGRAVPVP
jgi:hypothetical protein